MNFTYSGIFPAIYYAKFMLAIIQRKYGIKRNSFPGLPEDGDFPEPQPLTISVEYALPVIIPQAAVNQTLNLELYFACPVLETDQAPDGFRARKSGW